MKNKHISVFDFFSGCGGTSQGFLQAQMEIVLGLDYDRDACKSFKLNFPDAKIINADIHEIPATALKKEVELAQSKGFVLFSGCAPCQPFSKQNKNRIASDPRRSLLTEFGRFVKEFQPDLLFIENVPGLQKVGILPTPFHDFIKLLETLNYSYDFKIVSALWYGVPQNRKRLVLIASKNVQITFPLQQRLNKNEFSTVRDWIYDLPPIEAGETHSQIEDHQASNLSSLNLERIKHTKEGGGKETWPSHLQLDCHKNYKGHSDTYSRMAWDKPASVLTTRCTSYSNGRFGHPEQNRAISLREAALLQTFPMHYKFFGNQNSRAKQIGNAVPPLMAQKIGEHFMEFIS